MEAPEGLRILANVLDKRQADGLEASASTEVQEDLRRWANEWTEREQTINDLKEYVAKCSAMLPGDGLLAVKIQRLLDEHAQPVSSRDQAAERLAHYQKQRGL
jgi:hypothetical protein